MVLSLNNINIGTDSIKNLACCQTAAGTENKSLNGFHASRRSLSHTESKDLRVSQTNI